MQGNGPLHGATPEMVQPLVQAGANVSMLNNEVGQSYKLSMWPVSSTTSEYCQALTCLVWRSWLFSQHICLCADTRPVGEHRTSCCQHGGAVCNVRATYVLLLLLCQNSPTARYKHARLLSHVACTYALQEETPLHKAIQQNNVSLVRALLAAGAAVNGVDHKVRYA